MPDGHYPKDDSIFLVGGHIGWCRWDYLKGDRERTDEEVELITRSLYDIEDGILEAWGLAPEVVKTAVGAGEFTWQGCWATALFFLAMRNIHPMVSAWGDHIMHSPPKDASERADRFWDMNDRMILLSPDYRTATEHAFSAFRQMAKAASGESPQALNASPQIETPTVNIPTNIEELQAIIDKAEGNAYWNIICLVAQTGQDAAPDRFGVMRAYRPCCCTVCGITDTDLKNAENRLADGRSKKFKKQYGEFKQNDIAVAIVRVVKPELKRRIASLHASKKG